VQAELLSAVQRDYAAITDAIRVDATSLLLKRVDSRLRPTVGAADWHPPWKRDGNDWVKQGENRELPNLPKPA
jgi:hypothetical protein